MNTTALRELIKRKLFTSAPPELSVIWPPGNIAVELEERQAELFRYTGDASLRFLEALVLVDCESVRSSALNSGCSVRVQAEEYYLAPEASRIGQPLGVWCRPATVAPRGLEGPGHNAATAFSAVLLMGVSGLDAESMDTARAHLARTRGALYFQAPKLDSVHLEWVYAHDPVSRELPLGLVLLGRNR